MTSTRPNSQSRHAAVTGVPRDTPSLRLGPLSLAVRPRSVAVAVILALAAFLLFAFSLGRGDYPISLDRVLAILFTPGGDSIEHLVVLEWRMPRALAGLAVGAALGLAGALTQSITRNSLASPDILGITVGASAAAVTVIVASGGATTGLLAWFAGAGIPLAALCGALATSALIWVLSSRVAMDPFRLVLTGIIISALLGSYINYVLTTAKMQDVAKAQFWLSGSLGLVTWDRLLPVAVAVILCAPLVIWIAFALRAALLGRTIATALGQNVRATQFALLAIAVALTAVAVSAAGPIGFIAFVAPQLALPLSATASPPLLGSAFMGSVLLLSADLATETVLPSSVSVGLTTSALGGVFLIYLLVRTQRKGRASDA